MWHIKNELKELVTGDWIRVNPKNVAAYRQRNHVNIIYLSNEGQPLPLENDDRRHLVVYTPPPLSEVFYDELWQEIEAGAAAALHDYLLRIDLAEFHPKKRPPMTDAKKALIHLSLPSEQRFISELAEGELRWPAIPALPADLYGAYLRWCRENGEQRPRPSNHFLGNIGRVGWTKKKARIYRHAGQIHQAGEPRPDQTLPKWVVFPPQSVLAAHGRERAPAEPMMRWVTQCTIEFAAAGTEEAKERGFGQ
jgi:putative DNA primase/helicase